MEEPKGPNLLIKKNAYCIEEIYLLINTFIDKKAPFNELLDFIGGIKASEKYLIKEKYQDELLKFVKAKIKEEMVELVSSKNLEFINEARQKLTLESTYFAAWIDQLKINDVSLQDERILYWNESFKDFFGSLEYCFLPLKREEILRNVIKVWFTSGKMSLKVWNKWKDSFAKGISLKTLKSIEWPMSSRNDSMKHKFVKALVAIQTKDFVEKEKMNQLLNPFLTKPKIELERIEYTDAKDVKQQRETNVLNVVGNLIYLSEVKKKIEVQMDKKETVVEQIDFIAKHVLHIDTDLKWKGKNITFVADKVTVWDKRFIDVSGRSYQQKNLAAKNGLPGQNGADGKDGLAGESSGNIAFLTEGIINESGLILNLSGGDGSDGQNGGDGGAGRDGNDATQHELNLLKYDSIYWDLWSTFVNFKETLKRRGWTQTKNYERESEYIWYEFKDESGRKFYYTFGVEKRIILPNPYDLVIWIQGSQGSPGGIGGLSGKGGEGGASGEYFIINPTTGQKTDDIIHKIQIRGKDGQDGEMGKSGKPGKDGIDLALIDRSDTGRNKFRYSSDSQNRLTLKPTSKRHRESRINTYLRVIENNVECYGEFVKEPLSSNEKFEQQKLKETRSNEAIATSKKALSINKIIEKARKCKIGIDKNIFKDEIENDTEIKVIRNAYERETIYSSPSDIPKNSVEDFILKLKHIEKYQTLNQSNQILKDFFSIEFDQHLDHEIILKMNSLANTTKQMLSKIENKKCITNFRVNIGDFFINSQKMKASINEKIESNGGKLENVKKGNMFFYNGISVINSLFKNSKSNEIEAEAFKKNMERYNSLKVNYDKFFKPFENYDISWNEEWDKFKLSLSKSDVQKIVPHVHLFDDTHKLKPDMSDAERLNIAYDIIQMYFKIRKNIPDLELRKLITIRNDYQWEKEFNLYKQNVDRLTWEKEKFVSYFLQSDQLYVSKWIDSYLLITKNDATLLKMLYERFEVDGNHLEISDFQFIISTIAHLQITFKISSKFIFNLASSMSQHKLLDAFFVIRLESQWRKQLNSPRIMEELDRIKNNRLKILFATKIDDQKFCNKTFTEDNLFQIFFMLRHSKENELENETLEKWISIAAKYNKKNEARCFNSNPELKLLKYYLVYLRRHGKKDETNLLKKMLEDSDTITHIPEKLIGQICALIVGNEIQVDESYVFHLKNVLQTLTENCKGNDSKRCILMRDESEQVQILSKANILSQCKRLLQTPKRTLAFIAENIEGIHDENREERKMESFKIVKILENPKNKYTILIDKIETCIRKFQHDFSFRDTQKMAIMYAVESKNNLLSQVHTGEGKSYITAALAIIRSKQHKFVDIITSSPVLAKRDAKDMKGIFEAMGLTVAHNCSEDIEDRKLAYQAKIVYGEIGQFQRDYLLHHYYSKNVLGDRERSECCVIIDEVDNMLLDNGNNMLYLSHNTYGMELLESLFVNIQKLIYLSTNSNNEDGGATETIEAVILSDLIGRIIKRDIENLANDETAEEYIIHIWNHLIFRNLIDSDGYLKISNKSDFDAESIQHSLEKRTSKLHAKKIITCLKVVLNRRREISIPQFLIPFVRRHLREFIENAKRALSMKPNEDYVIDEKNAKVTIIDHNTGIDLTTSQWNEGLHQFIQIKHACRVDPISLKAVFISNVNYLKGYAKINGFSGTLGSIDESQTLKDLYNADLIKIPTFKARRFYEHIPFIAETEDEWLNAIFEKVNNQIIAGRSVLIICQSIDTVEQLKKKLIKLSRKIKDPKIEECYKTAVQYQRDFESFEYNDAGKLQSGKLIIATILAGRGTDIKISDELCNAGGLHIIITFIPKNLRIEDQAYGRAARCGEPGSGQIIALAPLSDTAENVPSVFELKISRDNSEMERLKAMTNHYKYHTKTEEKCLKHFKDLCLKAHENMKKNKKKDNEIPTYEKIIYSALLDEWAFWLDTQSAAIKKCTKEKSDKQQTDIIASAKDFVINHPISTTEEALKWIKCPYSILSLALVEFNNNRYLEAEEKLNYIIQNFPEFSGYAYYYKGVITQRNVRIIKNLPVNNEMKAKRYQQLANKIKMDINKFLQLLNCEDVLPDTFCKCNDKERIKTEDYFLQAIQTFYQKIERKHELLNIISRFSKFFNQQNINSNEYEKQANEVKAVNECLATSAFNMIGHSVNPLTFNPSALTIDQQFEAYEKFISFQQEGYVTSKLLSNLITDQQYEILRNNYLIPKKKIQQLFDELHHSENRIDFTVLQEEEVIKRIKLPSREEFWGFLKAFGCFQKVQEFYILNTSKNDIEEIKNLQPFKSSFEDKFMIQLSDYDLSNMILYDVSEVEQAFAETKKKLKWLESKEILIKDAVAVPDISKYMINAINFPNYSYFLVEELADWLECAVEEAQWIVQQLVNKGTLKETTSIFTKLNDNIPAVPNKMQKEITHLLQKSKCNEFDDFSFEVYKKLSKKDEKNALAFYKKLEEYKVITPVERKFYHQNSAHLYCPYLPECIKNSVELFLYNKFAYTFAYNNLFSMLTDSAKNPDIKITIPLPWKPYNNLFKDLIKYGFVHDHKIDISNKEFIDEDDQKNVKEIEDQIKSRLFIKSASLISTKKFFNDEKVEANQDIKLQAIITTPQVAKIGENYWWIVWIIVGIVIMVGLGYLTGFAGTLLDLVLNFNSYLTMALLVFAAVGSLFYFVQYYKAHYILSTERESTQERIHQLRTFHSENVKLQYKQKDSSKLIYTLSVLITAKFSPLFDIDFSKVLQKWHDEKNNSKMNNKKFNSLSIEKLEQQYEWNLMQHGIRDFLTKIKPKVIASFYTAINSCIEKNGINIYKAVDECQKVNKELIIDFSVADKKLLEAIGSKIVENIVIELQEHKNREQDNKVKNSAKMASEFNEIFSSIEDNIMEISDEINTKCNEEECNTNEEYIPSDDDSDDEDISEENQEETFVKAFKSKLQNVYKEEVTFQITQPLLKLFTKYIEHTTLNCQNFDHGFFNIDKTHSHEDQHLQDKNFEVMPCLFVDLQKAIFHQYMEQPTKYLLHHMIFHKHALHHITMELLVEALFQHLMESIPNLSFLEVILIENGKKHSYTFKSKNEKMAKSITLKLKLNNGYFYICQKDYKEVLKNVEESVQSCLFETIVENQQDKNNIYKNRAEDFRESILKYL